MKIAARKLLQKDLGNLASGRNEEDDGNESSRGLTASVIRTVPSRAAPSAPVVDSHMKAGNADGGEHHAKAFAHAPDSNSSERIPSQPVQRQASTQFCVDQEVQFVRNEPKETSKKCGDEAAAVAEQSLPNVPSATKTPQSATQGTVREDKLKALALELKSIRHMLNETKSKEVHRNSIPKMINVPSSDLPHEG